MKKSGDGSWRVYNWSIPAYKVLRGAHAGMVTCPMAGTCGQAGGCYALQGAYTWTAAQKSHTENYELTLTDDFVPQAIAEIKRKQKNAEKKNKKIAIRIHDAGDFYSIGYVKKWWSIAIACPGVQFYAYTKMVKLFQAMKKHAPTNMTMIFSEGGLQDKHIKQTDRHSRVFPSLDALREAGYDDASKDDKVAFLSGSGKIGLVYHGAKSKEWTTD